MRSPLVLLLAAALIPAPHALAASEPTSPAQLAAQYFGNDAPWFLDNIPFLEIDDPEIQQIYFYRWKLLRAHIRQIGPQGTTILEFLPDVPWAREPFTDLNDSASFHLAEARWLRSPAVVNDLIDHLYSGGANDRHFSESIAAATLATTFVTGNPAPALRHLDTMQHIYNLWDDHLDRTRNLYWIEPLLDATEYTISSIDASGAGFTTSPSKQDNQNGFTGGEAFRPSINSYQYANARAIAHLATLSGNPTLAADYTHRADTLRTAVLEQLWNPTLQHFTDRFQRSTSTVTAGDFIRGRELVGYTPWFYELPPNGPKATADPNYTASWKHLLTSTELAGPHGLRTVEPSYPRYLTQYRYDRATGLRECQWNGPSWPFQTSQTLTALANLLNDYPTSQSVITPDDYVHLLRQYTHQHLLPATDGAQPKPDLQEDYDPDTGLPIVGLPRSHHYAHSTYVDLVLSGLLGIRPRADNILEINPLLPASPTAQGPAIRFFHLERLKYHGHEIELFYDRDGTHYHRGSGLSVFVDGVRAAAPVPHGPIRIALKPAQPKSLEAPARRIDLAINPDVAAKPSGSTAPTASASSSDPAAPPAQAIDGRLWFFPEIANGWSPDPSEQDKSWVAVDLGQPQTLTSVELYFFAGTSAPDGKEYAPPPTIRLEYDSPTGWQLIPNQRHSSPAPIANGENRVTFAPITTRRIRAILTHPAEPQRLRLVELEAFGSEY